MSWNLQQTINWTQTYIQYVPLTAGLGGEPAVSIASMIRNSILNPPLTWNYNRAEQTFSTTVGTQDYTEAFSDLAFVEKVSITDDQGNIWELKDIYNNSALSPSAEQARPSAMSVERTTIVSSALNYVLRFMPIPDKIYTVTVVYQKLSPQFGPFLISSAANHVAGNTTYTGVFDALSFPAGSTAIITGFTTPANNGSFVVVSCTSTSLVVANGAGVSQTNQAYVSNYSWDPIPDQYSDVFNNLFLSEAMAMVDDARAQLYRQRGVAALLSKASGLTEMQKNAFAQQWLQRGYERQAVMGTEQLGHTGRGV